MSVNMLLAVLYNISRTESANQSIENWLKGKILGI